ncbi:hypothetical protein RF11_05553 [Thelohanellus kitauei]|uniref:Uncharacterized protein n=1 Tax=Thelohanellus kitauei TaxID=669202 RepID=A0A0C2J8V6_THEKT|nr:hypothetical protein RF11_05553 [Thelohanellus kitauei]
MLGLIYDLYISHDFGNKFEKIGHKVDKVSWVSGTTYIIYFGKSQVNIESIMVTILDASNKSREVHKIYNIKSYYQVRNEFIMLEYDEVKMLTDRVWKKLKS